MGVVKNAIDTPNFFDCGNKSVVLKKRGQLALFCCKMTPFKNTIKLIRNDKKISLRFSNDFFFQWVENLWKKESIEKLKCTSYFFVNTKMTSFFLDDVSLLVKKYLYLLAITLDTL